jgi:hypothetical protein
MDEDVFAEELIHFVPASGQWVAVFARPGSDDPLWDLVSIAGWATIEVHDGRRGIAKVIRPVLAGDTIDWERDENYLGIYTRADLESSPTIRRSLTELCTVVRRQAVTT